MALSSSLFAYVISGCALLNPFVIEIRQLSFPAKV